MFNQAGFGAREGAKDRPAACQMNVTVHLPEVATDPGCVGSRQIRPYVFEGRRLTLSDVEKDDPSVVRWKIVWAKVH